MWWRTLLVLVLIFSGPSLAFSQAIYGGGSGDGFALAGIIQADNANLKIFSGGNSDGFSIAGVTQTDNVAYNIYNGGVADGFSTIGLVQADNISYNIYNGGIADGFSTIGLIQADNISYNIYNGGIADGFSTIGLIQSDNVSYNIYNGGIADGFSIISLIQSDNVSYNIYNGGVSDGFAIKSLGGVGSEVPLPIELLSFSGFCNKSEMVIQWATASELNNAYFTVEKSVDGENWETLGKVDGAGYSSTVLNYTFTDKEVPEGISYYRLGQTDYNGQEKYSPVISLQGCGDDAAGLLTVFPNPAGAWINLTYHGSTTDVKFIDIYDVYGNRVYFSENFRSSIPLTDLKKGLYILRLNFPDKSIYKKIIVEK